MFNFFKKKKNVIYNTIIVNNKEVNKDTMISIEVTFREKYEGDFTYYQGMMFDRTITTNGTIEGLICFVKEKKNKLAFHKELFSETGIKINQEELDKAINFLKGDASTVKIIIL